MGFQEEYAPSQISPKNVSGCLNATLEQGVAGLSVGIASCGPGFNQAWYFDGDRIRNMMFYSDKCLTAVSNHFNVETASCKMPSLAAMKANLSASLCAPILTIRSLLRT